MDNTTLQDIKDRLNITDVISGYIQVKKAGTSFKALCPFHHEKTPSLQISPQKQIWHCFGCGEGGDIFGFVMKYENLEFKEALKLLANKAGVQLPDYKPANPKEQSEKELLLRINDFAARYYHQILINDKRGAGALEYLKNRGLTEKTIEKWQIGFAPDDFHSLEQALAKKNVSTQDAVKAGVLAKNERGQIYDRFRGRITFPIFDYNGDVVGFSARILQDDGNSAKYVNSPETIIYSKSKILFGLNFAKNAIRKSDEAVIVEGQMDSITAHQGGFENVVASSGTALTLEQLNLLGKLTKNLKFCFDADQAGQIASKKAGELALRQGFRLKVIMLEKISAFAKASADGRQSIIPAEAGDYQWRPKDPDELIKKSPGLWEKAVKEARWFLDWQMDFAQNKFAEDPVEQKLFLSSAVVPLISFIADPLEQDHYVRKMAERFNIFERTIREQIKKLSVAQLSAQNKPADASISPKINVQEKEILGGMLLYNGFAQEVLANIDDENFSDPAIKELIGKFRVGKTEEFKNETLAKEAIFMVESQKESLAGGETEQQKELKKTFALFKLKALKNRQQQLSLLIKQAETENDRLRVEQLNKEFALVSEQRMKFEKLS